MNKYSRSWPYSRPLNHYHRNTWNITLDWKFALTLVVGLAILGFIVWKISVHDFCPTYYGTVCLPH